MRCYNAGMGATEPKIHLLPNLMTAGNLFCGFMAVLTIFRGMAEPEDLKFAHDMYQRAILLIFGACVFDLLDGRVARMGGNESPFGREFDSLADVVSFGMAPALLVFKVVLLDLPDEAGWIIAFMYLLCGAMRLARFNCMAAPPSPSERNGDEFAAPKDFTGLPIPMAAATIAALTIFMIWMEEGSKTLGPMKYLLAVLMVGLSLLMMSHISYPSFKKVNWRSRTSVPWVVLVFFVLLMTVRFYQWMPALLCVGYILYGFLRPWLPSRWRHGIEVPFAEDDEVTPPKE